MKGDWKPREEYKTLVERHKPILVRNNPPGPIGPMVVIYSTHGPERAGHFYPVPGVPMFCGNHVFTMAVNDSFDEWMDIPE